MIIDKNPTVINHDVIVVKHTIDETKEVWVMLNGLVTYGLDSMTITDDTINLQAPAYVDVNLDEISVMYDKI